MKKADEIILYKRPDYYIPRIAAVHDLCGYGNCSLAVAMSVLSSGGNDVCPVPTSLFSSHTKYKHFSMLDTTDFLPEYLESWKKVNVDIDAVYSGFLGSAKQVELIKELYETYPKALRVLDPVMGDGGMIYPTYTPELCEAMGSLCEGADILTPNLTEASILTGRKYQGQDPSDTEVNTLIKELIKLGAKHVVLKGIERGGEIFNFVGGIDCETVSFGSPLLPFSLHGTGDLYCSALTAAVFVGKNLAFAVKFAADVVRSSMESSVHQPEYQDRGVSFELMLYKISELVKNSVKI